MRGSLGFLPASDLNLGQERGLPNLQHPVAWPSHQMGALHPWMQVCSALCPSGSFILAFKPHRKVLKKYFQWSC